MPSNSATDLKPLGPESLVWKFGGEWTALLGGGRALVLQVAHPVVAAGIAQFSDYQHDPWKRLQGTLDLYLTTVFGGQGEAINAGAALRAMHRNIRGVDASGQRYHALAPEPYTWVHATLVDSLIEAIEAFQRPLSTAEREQIYAEMGQVGRLYGIRPQDLPEDWAGFVSYRDEMISRRLEVSETLMTALESIMHLPPPSFLPIARPFWPVLGAVPSRISALVTAGLLPTAVRESLGLEWTPGKARALRLLQSSLRRLAPLLPRRVRLMPIAYRAWLRDERAQSA